LRQRGHGAVDADGCRLRGLRRTRRGRRPAARLLADRNRSAAGRPRRRPASTHAADARRARLTMFLPRAFAESALARLDALVASDPFVPLVTTDGDGLPFASHVPVLYQRDGDTVAMEGHWAKANPQSSAGH